MDVERINEVTERNLSREELKLGIIVSASLCERATTGWGPQSGTFRRQSIGSDTSCGAIQHKPRELTRY